MMIVCIIVINAAQGNIDGMVILDSVIHPANNPLDGLEHLQWAKDFLKRFDGKYKKWV